MAEIDKVEEFLEQNNLSQYLDKFIEEGYDNFGQIISMADSAEELEGLMKDVGMFYKFGHRKRFVAAVHVVSSKNKNGEPTDIPADSKLFDCESEQDFQYHLSKCMYLI